MLLTDIKDANFVVIMHAKHCMLINVQLNILCGFLLLSLSQSYKSLSTTENCINYKSKLLFLIYSYLNFIVVSC